MKRFAVLVLGSSLIWGSIGFAKGAASVKAIKADRANLVKARAAASARMRADGPTAAQRLADAANLAKARASRARAK